MGMIALKAAGGVKALFEECDFDHNTRLDKEEFTQGIGREICWLQEASFASDEQLEQMFHFADKNGDGKVSLAEFEAWCADLCVDRSVKLRKNAMSPDEASESQAKGAGPPSINDAAGELAKKPAGGAEPPSINEVSQDVVDNMV